MGPMLFLKVPTLGNTNWYVAGHLRRGTYGKELMSPPTERGPKATVSHKVSLETGHHS